MPLENNSDKEKKKKRPVPWNIIIVAGAFLLFILLFLVISAIRNDRVRSIFTKSGTISFLFLGSDEISHKGRTDTIMLGYFNTRTQKLGIVVVPRDMKIRIKGVYYDKINALYATQGIGALKKNLEDISGIPIQFTAVMDLQGLMRVLDIIGTIRVYNEKPLKYVDEAQGLYIDLPEGDLDLDGEKAMQYVRFRADERGDIGRSDRQLEVIQLIAKKVLVERDFMKNLAVIRTILKNLRTNVTFNDAIMFLKYSSSFKFTSIESLKLPGSFQKEKNREYIIVEPEVARNRIKEFYTSIGTLAPEFDPRRVTVQVLNGTDIPGLASKFRSRLLYFGFNVVEFGNADSHNFKKTLVLDRSGNLQAAQKVAEIINCETVYPKINRLMLVDTTVIIGEDMAPKKPAK
jgi:polyisoprenyl-teichoic acid--peptidoglycan teichoic acid transferase